MASRRSIGSAAQRQRIRQQLGQLRRRVDHQVVRYSDRARWLQRFCRVVRPTGHSAGSAAIGLGLVLAAAAVAYRWGGEGFRQLGRWIGASNWNQTFQQLAEALQRHPDAPVDAEGDVSGD